MSGSGRGESAPDRVWTDGTNIVTASEKLADEMRALGDTVVEYVHVSRYEGAVKEERRLIVALVRSLAFDSWDPSVEAALRETARQIACRGQS